MVTAIHLATIVERHAIGEALRTWLGGKFLANGAARGAAEAMARMTTAQKTRWNCCIQPLRRFPGCSTDSPKLDSQIFGRLNFEASSAFPLFRCGV